MIEPANPSGEKPTIAAVAGEPGPAPRGEKDMETASVPPQTAIAHVRQTWNNPRVNLARVAVTCFAFFLTGLNEASIGPLIPYFQEYYHLSYSNVSYIFLMPVPGYILAALLNDTLAQRFGRRVAAVLVPICRIITYVVICLHPPYPVVAVMVCLMGFAISSQDGAYNAWVGGVLEDPAIPLSCMHASYGIGSLISPLILGSLIEYRALPWYTFHYMMLGLAGVELAVSLPSFWGENAAALRAQHAQHAAVTALEQDDASSPSPKEPESTSARFIFFHRPWATLAWLLSIWLFFNIATEYGLGGWTTSYTRDARGAEPFAAALASTGYWTGLTVGRLAVSFVLRWAGEKRVLTVVSPLILALQLVYWLAPGGFTTAAVAVGFQGFLIGPTFPAFIMLVARQVPKRLHIPFMSLTCIIGRLGAGLIPFLVGPAADGSGVWVVQPFMISMEVAMISMWLMIPKEDAGQPKFRGTWWQRLFFRVW